VNHYHYYNLHYISWTKWQKILYDGGALWWGDLTLSIYVGVSTRIDRSMNHYDSPATATNLSSHLRDGVEMDVQSSVFLYVSIDGSSIILQFINNLKFWITNHLNGLSHRLVLRHCVHWLDLKICLVASISGAWVVQVDIKQIILRSFGCIHSYGKNTRFWSVADPKGGQSGPWPPLNFIHPFILNDYLVLSVEKNRSFR
jgi:hypothetical protein